MGLQPEPGWLSIELEQSSCILQWVAQAQLVQGLRGWESSLIWLITFHQFLRVVCSFFIWSSKREFHWVRGYFPWHVNECHLSRVYAFMGVSYLIEKKNLSHIALLETKPFGLGSRMRDVENRNQNHLICAIVFDFAWLYCLPSPIISIFKKYQKLNIKYFGSG